MNIKTLLQRKNRQYLTDLEMLILMEMASGEEILKAKISQALNEPTKTLDVSFKKLLRHERIVSRREGQLTYYRITGTGATALRKVLS